MENDITPQLSADSLRRSAIDLGRAIEAGSEDTLLVTITARADNLGTSAILIFEVSMDADGGAILIPAVNSGAIET